MTKKVLAVLITDTHLGPLNIELVENLFEEAISLCKRRKTNKLIHIGDFFETRSSLTIEVLASAQNIFNKLEDSGLSIDIIAGNHDRPYEKRESYLTLYNQYYKNIHFYDDIDYYIQDDYIYTFLPNWNKCLKKKLKNFDFEKIKNAETKKKILFAHHQIQEIPVEIQSIFDFIFMGHLHDLEKMTDKSMYIGSAYQQNFAEDNRKGFSVLYDDLSIKQIKSKFKEYFIQKVDLNTFSEEEIKLFISKFRDENPDKFLRVIFEGFNKDIIHLTEYCKKLKIDVISRVKNNILTQENNDLNLSELDKDQILNYFTEFTSNNLMNKDVKNILINILNE